MATRMMYDTSALRLDQKQSRLNMQIPTFMRAPAETPGMFALESAVDELAVKLNMDPIELRILNEPAKDIHKDKPFSGRHLVACMRAGAARFGWRDRTMQSRQRREGSWLIGMGMAVATYPTISFATEAKVTLNADGTAHIDCCTQEIGTGTETVQCQLLADMLGIQADKVSMKLGDSDLPAGGVSGGSTTAMSVGGALRNAVEKLKSQLVELTKADSPRRETELDGIVFESGQLRFKQEKVAWGEGYISGGCLEKDLLRRVWSEAAISPRLMAFDTRSDSLADARYNTGCQGVVHVLCQPINSKHMMFLTAASRVVKQRQTATLLTVYRSQWHALHAGDAYW